MIILIWGFILRLHPLAKDQRLRRCFDLNEDHTNIQDCKCVHISSGFVIEFYRPLDKRQRLLLESISQPVNIPDASTENKISRIIQRRLDKAAESSAASSDSEEDITKNIKVDPDVFVERKPICKLYIYSFV